MKQKVIVTKSCITSAYGPLEASDKPREFDADFAAHLIEIGNAELHGDPATSGVAKAAGLNSEGKPAKKDSPAKPADSKKASKKGKQ